MLYDVNAIIIAHTYCASQVSYRINAPLWLFRNRLLLTFCYYTADSCWLSIVFLPIHWTYRNWFTLSLFIQRVRTLLTSISRPLNDDPVSRLRGGSRVICWTWNTIFTKRLRSGGRLVAQLDLSECFSGGRESKMMILRQMADTYSLGHQINRETISIVKPNISRRWLKHKWSQSWCDPD